MYECNINDHHNEDDDDEMIVCRGEYWCQITSRCLFSIITYIDYPCHQSLRPDVYDDDADDSDGDGNSDDSDQGIFMQHYQYSIIHSIVLMMTNNADYSY